MHDPVGVALPLLGYQLVKYLLYRSQPSSRRRRKKQSEQLPEAKLVGSHRPDGVTFIVIVTSDVREQRKVTSAADMAPSGRWLTTSCAAVSLKRR